MSAYHLASPNGDGTYSPEQYGFVSPEAAAKAAAKMNPRRGARDLPPYTALAVHDGDTFVDVLDLEVRP